MAGTLYDLPAMVNGIVYSFGLIFCKDWFAFSFSTCLLAFLTDVLDATRRVGSSPDVKVLFNLPVSSLMDTTKGL